MRILRLGLSVGTKVINSLIELFWNTENSMWNDLNRNWND